MNLILRSIFACCGVLFTEGASFFTMFMFSLTTGLGGKVTLLDIAKSMDPDGNIGATAELLSQTNEILLDMPWFEGNTMTGHKHNIRTGLPTAIWRQMYQGVPASKSSRAIVEDSVGMLETRSEVDKDLLLLNGNEAAFRLSEGRAFIEGMNQTFAEQLIYGNTSINPERFMGLAPRYSAISGAANAQSVIDGLGTGSDNTSVWLVVWGKETVFGIYPKGSKTGLIHQDLGEIDAFDVNNNRYRAMADRWQWKCGIAIKDWRYVIRIANIDTTDLVSSTGTQNAHQLMKLMIRALARIPFAGMGNAVFYANRTVKEMLAVQALDKSQNALGITEAATQFGPIGPSTRQELRFFGVPIRLVDRITNAEAQVV